MSTCRQCLAEIPAGARKCQFCGSEQVHPAVPYMRFAIAVLVGLIVAMIGIQIIWG